MSDPVEIDKRVANTELASILAKGAQQQRGGVLASLGLIADSLRMLPTKEQATSTWSATEWAEKREGWIFITSKAAEREALRPSTQPVDRFARAEAPQTPPNQIKRRSGLCWMSWRVCSGFLNCTPPSPRIERARIRWCSVSRARLSSRSSTATWPRSCCPQPATKIFLKTTEPKAAEWVSKAIGQVEIERMKETHYDGTRSGKNFSLDRQTEPLVMDSEISGLADKHAFLKLGNNVARFSFVYSDMPAIAADFVPRSIEDDELSFDPKTLAPKPKRSNEASVSGYLPERRGQLRCGVH